MKQTTSKTVFFVTYRNKETQGMWRKSRQYNTMGDLMKAMQPYLEQHPRTTVQFQTDTITQFEGQA